MGADAPYSAKTQLAILISGRGSNMKALIEACQAGDLNAEPKLVISHTPKAAGLEIARSLGVQTMCLDLSKFTSKQAYEKELTQVLKGNGIDLILLAGYMRLVGAEFIQAFRDRIINIHPSLLPAFKGLNGQKQAFEYGVKITGCTVHLVSEELDSGRILMQTAIPIEENDTVESLSDRLIIEEHKLYPKAVQEFITKELKK